jgi:peptidoglycan/LPS O-acetylase OafA/YrhL
MILGLALCSIAFNFVDITQVQGEVLGIWPVVILGAMVVYVAGYAVGMGNVPWQQSESVLLSFLPYSPFFLHNPMLSFPFSVVSSTRQNAQY